MILYHGTNIDFQQIRLEMSRVGKDFGYGFYLTTDKDVAARQAERKLLQFGTGTKVVHLSPMIPWVFRYVDIPRGL